MRRFVVEMTFKGAVCLLIYEFVNLQSLFTQSLVAALTNLHMYPHYRYLIHVPRPFPCYTTPMCCLR